ncbi:La-related protein 1C [Cyberlindnera fabianii]|uniref:La-related protein 1C n=1 Tax=Cyberlindnera fabianii TaxID=36022 RepID=A0A1V2L7G8_CYBFA|nr:La-related protein 1C [Cyberlindnera fabianii]
MSESTSSSPASTSKLVPAAAPVVSAWGKKTEASNSQAAEPPAKSEEWPSADIALSKSASKTTSVETAKEKPKVAQPKVKSTGKEKWLPFEANITLASEKSGNNQQQKKKQNNGNNKKKQNNNGGNANGSKQKKDGQANKGNQNGQKKDSSQAKRQNKKSTIDEAGADSANKKVKDNKENKIADGTIKSPIAVPATTEPQTTASKAVDSQQSATLSEEAKSVSETASLPAIPSIETSPGSAVSGEQTPQNPKKSSQTSHSQKHQFPQHRNSEPFTSNNGFHNNNNSGNRGGRRYNNNNKYNNGMRHSISGAPYGNVPYLVNYNYPYMPIMQAPGQYGFPVGFNNFQSAPGSRSNSQSPSKGEFASLSPPVSGIPPFTQPVIYNPYNVEQDPMTLVVQQLNYYFSGENLVKDFYLRRQMNSNGFVSLKKLIEFNRLKRLTGGDIEMMKTALNLSPNLEVKNEKVRVSNNWSNWVLPYDQRDAAGKVEDEDSEEENNADENKV